MPPYSPIFRKKVEPFIVVADKTFWWYPPRILSGPTITAVSICNPARSNTDPFIFVFYEQVVFANNTISGIFVIIGLAVADIWVCVAGLLAATLATVTGLVNS